MGDQLGVLHPPGDRPDKGAVQMCRCMVHRPSCTTAAPRSLHHLAGRASLLQTWQARKWPRTCSTRTQRHSGVECTRLLQQRTSWRWSGNPSTAAEPLRCAISLRRTLRCHALAAHRDHANNSIDLQCALRMAAGRLVRLRTVQRTLRSKHLTCKLRCTLSFGASSSRRGAMESCHAA